MGTVISLPLFSMKKFTTGVIVGISSVAVAIPVLAQLASAASGDTSSAASSFAKTRPVPTQACIEAMAAQDTNFLAHIDATIAAQKAATQAHKDALLAAASITDNTERAAALKKANEDFRTAMKNAMGSQADIKASMDALKAACGNGMGFGGPGMMMFGGPVGSEMRGDAGKHMFGKFMRHGRGHTGTGSTSSASSI